MFSRLCLHPPFALTNLHSHHYPFLPLPLPLPLPSVTLTTSSLSSFSPTPTPTPTVSKKQIQTDDKMGDTVKGRRRIYIMRRRGQSGWARLAPRSKEGEDE